MKKFLALALASVMAVSLVACGSTNADTNAESSAAATTTATTAESSSEEPGLKIAIVSSPSGVDDGSFNQDLSLIHILAGYHDGKLTVLRLKEDGSIGEITDEIYHKGLGSMAERNFRPHINCARMTHDNKYLLVADQGMDCLLYTSRCV